MFRAAASLHNRRTLAHFTHHTPSVNSSLCLPANYPNGTGVSTVCWMRVLDMEVGDFIIVRKRNQG